MYAPNMWDLYDSIYHWQPSCYQENTFLCFLERATGISSDWLKIDVSIAAEWANTAIHTIGDTIFETARVTGKYGGPLDTVQSSSNVSFSN